MTFVVMMILLLMGGVIEGIVPGVSLLAGSKLPLLLAVSVYYALTRDRPVAVVAAVLCGVVHDALCYVPLGYSSLAFLAVGVGANRFKDVVFTESIVTSSFFGAVTGAACAVIMTALLWDKAVLGERMVWTVVRIGGMTLLSALTAPFVFALAFRLDRMVGNVEKTKDNLSEEGFRYA